MNDHWDRINESANWVDPNRELHLPTIVQDICRALLDIRNATNSDEDKTHTNTNTNTNTRPLYEFTFDAVTRPDDLYYYTRWDKSRPVTVLAVTEQEAINKADAMLGDAGPHHHWVFRTVSVVNVRSPR